MSFDGDDVREDRRQRATESLGLTEPVRNPQLDRITRVARAMFGVQMSSITVMDHDRALFPGRGGFGADEIGRTDTPCHLVVDSGEIVTTDDALADPRFDDVAAMAANDMHFYIGHPLRDRSGNVVGSFCLIDKEPRTFSDAERGEFEDLAAWAQGELLADAEAMRARATQQALLPAAPLVTDEVRVSGLCIPALSVGGDYYDYGRVGRFTHIAIGDVMGKGTAAAILGAATRAAARAVVPAVPHGQALGHAVEQVERAMLVDLQRTGSFVTYFHAMLDLSTGTMYTVDAGAGLAILVRADGTTERLTGRGLPLGIELQEHTTTAMALRPGDRLVLVSDGVLDVMDDPIRWVDELSSITRASGDIDEVLERISAISRDRVPVDDVTVVIAEYHP